MNDEPMTDEEIEANSRTWRGPSDPMMDLDDEIKALKKKVKYWRTWAMRFHKSGKDWMESNDTQLLNDLDEFAKEIKQSKVNWP